jgi:DNA invertase Pin-like site-specific DNA recombinase
MTAEVRSGEVGQGVMVCAAEYVRMSTEHQQYSTENQRDAIRKYAEQHGIRIVRTYQDAGKSGLRLTGRDALQQLLTDVQAGAAEFRTILVYDISRWGRFQDADESAYYEYVCKRNGIIVQYCAEAFTNDYSPTATIIKSVKRAMAGEYSRELSVKVFAGQCRLIELGYRQGGAAGFGLRRMLQDHQGTHKGVLAPGEHKSIQTDRVILVPGPAEEVAIVQRIYGLFTADHCTEQAIATLLNSEGVSTDLGRAWTTGTVHQILTNPKYQGSNVYNRISFKLKQKRVKNPPAMWIAHETAFAPLVNPSLFAQAQELIATRQQHLTDDELLGRLQTLLQARGALSSIIIDETPGMPSASTYRSRFTSLVRAYQLVGYHPRHDYAYLLINQRLREQHARILDDLAGQLAHHAASVASQGRGQLRINGEFTLGLVVSRCVTTPAGALRWSIHLDVPSLPDLTLATRLRPENDAPLDYYLLPSIDMTLPHLRLRQENRLGMDIYRCNDLNQIYSLARRSKITEAA